MASEVATVRSTVSVSAGVIAVIWVAESMVKVVAASPNRPVAGSLSLERMCHGVHRVTVTKTATGVATFVSRGRRRVPAAG